ncbi:DNA polymerase I [Acetobacter orientalis]|nr:DNA polymerase I [Acetobacter orientalis]
MPVYTPNVFTLCKRYNTSNTQARLCSEAPITLPEHALRHTRGLHTA